MVEIPLRRRAMCVHCMDFVDTENRRTLRQISAWTPCAGTGGQSNSLNRVSMAKDLGRYMCYECYEKLKRGIPVGQQNLFAIGDYVRESSSET